MFSEKLFYFPREMLPYFIPQNVLPFRFLFNWPSCDSCINIVVPTVPELLCTGYDGHVMVCTGVRPQFRLLEEKTGKSVYKIVIHT